VAGFATYLSILTSNVNGLNTPLKDTIWQIGLKRKIQQSVLLTETNTSLGRKAGRRFIKLMVPKTGKNRNTYIRHSRLISKLTLVKWDKDDHFVLIKGSIHQREITIINLYAPNVSAPNFLKYANGLKKTYRPQHNGSVRL
jgi:tRNA isopentenyl-2-thiomethyl-A-37 hydroxylase MiaE